MEHDKVNDFRDVLFYYEVYTPQEVKLIAESCIDYLCEKGYEVSLGPVLGGTVIEAVKTEVL